VINRRYINLLFIISKGRINLADLARKTEISMPHLSIMMQQFFKEKIIYKRVNGRECEIELTDDGKEIVSMLHNISDKIERMEAKNGLKTI